MDKPINTTLRASKLYLSPLNPRRHINVDTPEWGNFVGNIKALGVHTALFLRKRPQENGSGIYEILAGQRRWIGAQEALGEDCELPVRIFECGDFEAACLAVSENTERSAMSVMDEVHAAANLLGFMKGDREETAKRMGWSLPTLNNRLKLMTCVAAVRDGVNAGTILLGQAEMLAGLRSEDQTNLLAQYPAGLPPAKELESVILATSGLLEKAIFDKSECQACPQNSAQQQALFGTFGDGRCLNMSCFGVKTEAQLAIQEAKLGEKYAKVMIVRPGERMTFAQVRPDRLGDEQATACRSCGNFGACVSAMPDTVGKEAEGLCFDTVCNVQKASTWASYIAALKLDAQPADPAEPAQVAGKATKSAKAAGATKGKGAPAKKAAPKPPVPSIVALREPVRTWRDTFYTTVLMAELGGNPERMAQYTLALMAAGRQETVDSSALREKLQTVGKLPKSVGSRDLLEAYSALQAGMSKEQATNGCIALGSLSLGKIDRKERDGLVALLNVDLGLYFRLNDEQHRALLTNVLTKNEIAALCHELGLDTALGAKFAPLVNGKKDALIAEICNVEGFDYVGKVPNCLIPEPFTKRKLEPENDDDESDGVTAGEETAQA